MSAYRRPHRRVVTGLDDQGRSCAVVDGPPISLGHGVNDGGGGGYLWRTAAVPADNSGREDIAIAPPFSYDWFHDGGSNFMVVEQAPSAQAYMHATDTIDYAVILSGEVTLVLEAGETKLRKGDFLIDRGVNHGWRNDGPDKAVYAVITLPAHPVGKGKTV